MGYLAFPDCLPMTKQHRQPQINVALSQPPTPCKCKAKGNRSRCSVKPSCDLSLVSSPAHLRPASTLRPQLSALNEPHINSNRTNGKAKKPFASFDGFKNQIRILCLARHLEFRRSVDRDIFLLLYQQFSFGTRIRIGNTGHGFLSTLSLTVMDTVSPSKRPISSRADQSPRSNTS
jgi:hypothetical protein